MSRVAAPVRRASALWGRLPLSARLTAVVTTLLVVGLLIAGVLAQHLLRQSLVAQVDAQLAGAAPALVAQFSGRTPPTGLTDGTRLTDYHVQLSTPSGEPARTWPATTGTGTSPDLPALDAREVLAREGVALTVPSTTGHERWRALASPLVSEGVVVATVTVALPLSGADATLAQMRAALVATGIVVVGLGGVVGRWAVRRALLPLGEIEVTAAAIAAGDLSRRVPDGPTGTETGRLAEALNGMLSQIERAFDARTASEERMRRFVADASHELRTPLASIRGYAELHRMGASGDPADVDRTFERIEDSARRMGRLVEDLLQLARLDEARPRARQAVDLAVLAADAVADLHALDPARPVRLEPLAGGLAGAVVDGEEDRLRQVLANLAGNAVEHTPAGTAVEIAVGRVATTGTARAVVEVRDHGPGIDPDHAARVFERFYRVDPGRSREHGGAGLGLAIVAAIVAAHDGTVAIRQTPGGGTTVRVELPCAGPVLDAPSDDP